MSSISFPAGSRIGDFVIGELVFRDDACGVYLAKDAEGKEYTLTVPVTPPGPELESDMAVWSSPKRHEFVAGIRVVRSPLPLVAVPYTAGLTLSEFLLTGRRFSEPDALELVHLAAEGASVLARAGCRNRLIGKNNLFISAEGAIKLLPSFDASSQKADRGQALRDLMEEILHAAAEPKGRAAALLAEIEALPRDVSISTLILTVLSPRKDPEPRPGGTKKLVRTGGFALLAAAAAAALFLFVLSRQKEARDAETDNTVRLTSNHHTSGPQIHELAAPEESSPGSPPPVPEQSAVPPRTAAKKVPAGPRGKPPKAVKRSVPAPRAAAKRPGPSPAADAARRGNLLLLRTAISSKYDLERPDRYGRTALEYASAAAWKQMIDILVNAGAKVTPQAIAAAPDIKTRNYLLALKNPHRAQAPAKNKAKPKPVPPPERSVIPDTAGWKEPPRKMWGVALEPALRKARAQDRPVLVFFTKDTRSDAMKDMARNVLFSPEFRRLARSMELVWINVSEKERLPQAQLAYNKRVRDRLFKNCPLPSALVLGPDGKLRGHISGVRTKIDFISGLRRLLRR
ncbi:MAG: hypothetical protein IJU70_07315 [Lentisphaeria bacterium]|nr:hypothetical protein [Lentisphaeria bacterium]